MVVWPRSVMVAEVSKISAALLIGLSSVLQQHKGNAFAL
jgi:hypothetical protein